MVVQREELYNPSHLLTALLLASLVRAHTDVMFAWFCTSSTNRFALMPMPASRGCSRPKHMLTCIWSQCSHLSHWTAMAVHLSLRLWRITSVRLYLKESARRMRCTTCSICCPVRGEQPFVTSNARGNSSATSQRRLAATRIGLRVQVSCDTDDVPIQQLLREPIAASCCRSE